MRPPISGNTSTAIDLNNVTTIRGNKIGTNAAGTGALPNGIGISFHSAVSGSTIGGNTPAARNVISGNAGRGIGISSGLGDPSVISWGRLIENAFNDDAILNNAWWAIIPPGLCVTLVVLGATLFGQSLEDALNPRLRVGHLSVRRFKVRPLRGKLDAE